MRIGLPFFAAIVFLSLVAGGARSQEVSTLQSHYSGRVRWNEAGGVLAFESSGRIDFGRPDLRATIWEVPPQVKKLVLERGVRVEGAFTISASVTVEGKGRESEIFGTPMPAALHDRGLDHDGGCMPYSAFYATGGDTHVTVRNLTSRDPIGFHFTGQGGAVFDLDGVAAIDDRGGFYNHSDGIQAGPGTMVKNSFFSTADDVIKVYGNISVADTTIVMIPNAVPIQLGWGSYGDGAQGTFTNLQIVGDSGRNADKAVIAAHSGTYKKTLTFHGLFILNGQASLFEFNDPGASVDVLIDQANITVARYAGALKAAGHRSICGGDAESSVYRCD